MANKTYKYIRRNQNPIDHHLYNDAEYTLLEFGYDSKGHRKSIVVVDEDGSVYDILINLNRRTEVKTATNGLNKKSRKLTNTWQHENIYEENIWDDLLLLDINPNGFYLTHIPHSKMCFGEVRHTILEKKSTKHLTGWKFDSSRASLIRGLEAGITTYIGVDNNGNISDDDKTKLRRFIVEKFSN